MFRSWRYWSNSRTLQNVAVFCILFFFKIMGSSECGIQFRGLSRAKYLGNTDTLVDIIGTEYTSAMLFAKVR